MNYQKAGARKISELFNIAKNGLMGRDELQKKERLKQLLDDPEVDPNEISQHNPYNPLRLSMSNGRSQVFKILINHPRVNTRVDYIDPFHPGGQIDMGKEGLFDAILNCGDVMKHRGYEYDYLNIVKWCTDYDEAYRNGVNPDSEERVPKRSRNIIETHGPIREGDMSFFNYKPVLQNVCLMQMDQMKDLIEFLNYKK